MHGCVLFDLRQHSRCWVGLAGLTTQGDDTGMLGSLMQPVVLGHPFPRCMCSCEIPQRSSTERFGNQEKHFDGHRQ